MNSFGFAVILDKGRETFVEVFMETIKMGSVEGVIQRGKPGGPCVVLFHGYGADSSDLAPLSYYLNVSKDVTWIFPQGPLPLMMGAGMVGRAWFPIDEKAIEQAMSTGLHRDFSVLRPTGMDAAVSKAKEVYNYCLENHSKVAIGGFSQGAMVATDVVLGADIKPKALLVLSGTLVDKKNWKVKAASCQGLRFFQSHGKKDALLGFQAAQSLEKLFLESGMDGMLLEFNGGHEIPPQVLAELKSFLLSILS